jgi:hypothetical protein
MKRLLTLILTVISMTAISQEIDKYETDEFTGAKIITTKSFSGKSVKKTDFIDSDLDILLSISYRKAKDADEIYLISLNILTNKKFGCLSEHKGKMMILFEDDSTMTLKQISKTNCNSSQLSANYLPLSDDQSKETIWRDILLENVTKLSKSRLKKIRIYGTEGYYDYTIKEDKRDIIIHHFNSLQTKL